MMTPDVVSAACDEAARAGLGGNAAGAGAQALPRRRLSHRDGTGALAGAGT